MLGNGGLQCLFTSLGFRVEGFGFRVEGFQGLGFRVWEYSLSIVEGSMSVPYTTGLGYEAGSFPLQSHLV